MEAVEKRSFYSDASHNYMVLPCPPGVKDDYQYKMVAANQIRGLLPCSGRRIDNQEYLYYDITSRQSMADLYDRRPVRGGDLQRLLEDLLRVEGALTEYLLDASHVVLDPACIYLDIREQACSFAYFPGEEQDAGWERLFSFLADHVDGRDKGAAALAYRLCMLAERPGFRMRAEVLEELGMHVQDSGRPGRWGAGGMYSSKGVCMGIAEMAGSMADGPGIPGMAGTMADGPGGRGAGGDMPPYGADAHGGVPYGGTAYGSNPYGPGPYGRGPEAGSDGYGLQDYGRLASEDSLWMGGGGDGNALPGIGAKSGIDRRGIRTESETIYGSRGQEEAGQKDHGSPKRFLVLSVFLSAFGIALCGLGNFLILDEREMVLSRAVGGAVAVAGVVWLIVQAIRILRARKDPQGMRDDGPGGLESAGRDAWKSEGASVDAGYEREYGLWSDAGGGRAAKGSRQPSGPWKPGADCAEVWTGVPAEGPSAGEDNPSAGWARAMEDAPYRAPTALGETCLLHAGEAKPSGLYGVGLCRGEQVSLSKLPCVVGKMQEYVDQILPDETVSRMHARFAMDREGRMTVRDLNSTNGTWLNGERLAPNECRPMQAGDHVRLGRVEFVYR